MDAIISLTEEEAKLLAEVVDCHFDTCSGKHSEGYGMILTKIFQDIGRAQAGFGIAEDLPIFNSDLNPFKERN